MKKLLSFALAALLVCGALPFTGFTGLKSEAKTVSSAKGEKIFLYAEDSSGKAVLVRVLDLEELKKLAHGQPDGGNYYYSSTDNYPTSQYCEARGVTIDELLACAVKKSTATGASDLLFRSGDTISLMATDSYGNYTRTWQYDDLLGTERYYFEGMYDPQNGWKTSWEVAGEDTSKFGIDLDTYREKYQDADENYADKKAVFETGVKMPVLLATESFSGRTTTETLSASTEAGISAQIAANGGKAAGSLRNMLSDDTALRLCIPMTEADLMAAHRTAYDNFKWVYNLKLIPQNSRVQSQGTVAEPQASFSQSGNTVTVSLSCGTPDATIYYSLDGAPQHLYTGPFTYDTQGADLTANPVTVYMTAVKEGCDDAGVLSARYPQSGVVFKTLYSARTGQDIVFEAESGVTDGDWNAWTSAILGITMKSPSGSSYTAVDSSSYRIDNDKKSLVFSSKLGQEPGAYSFIISAKGFSNKRLSVSLKNEAPALKDITAVTGSEVTVSFDNSGYQSNAYLYITPENGEKQMISTGSLDRSVPGQITIRADWFSEESCPAKEAGRYTLEVMNSSYTPVTQTLTLTLVEPGNFLDVPENAWFAEAVSWAVEHQVFNGISEKEFAPDLPMTRAMFATVLWRMNGSPEPSAANAFSDVKAGQWYTKAVGWASEKAYISGYGGGIFGTEDSVTREQIATIVFRFTSQDPGRKELAAVRGDLGIFTDRSTVSGWAADAMSWANGIRMINGMGEGLLAPQGLATRAQVATMLMNYSKQTG